MKVYENEYETVFANSPEGAKEVIRRCIDDHLTLEEIDDFELSIFPPRIVYDTMERIPKCIKNAKGFSVEMIKHPYYGDGEYYGVAMSLSDWEEIAGEYIAETGGAFICTTEY